MKKKLKTTEKGITVPIGNNSPVDEIKEVREEKIEIPKQEIIPKVENKDVGEKIISGTQQECDKQLHQLKEKNTVMVLGLENVGPIKKYTLKLVKK